MVVYNPATPADADKIKSLIEAEITPLPRKASQDAGRSANNAAGGELGSVRNSQFTWELDCDSSFGWTDSF